MPYPNEHAARQKDPKKYKRVRRENDKFAPGIHAIWGVLPDGTVELQAVRFDKKKFKPAQAAKWLKEHKMKTAVEKAQEKKMAQIAAVEVFSGDESAFSPTSAMLVDAEGKEPKRRCYKKQLLCAGDYMHPIEGWTKSVSDEDLTNLATNFQQMKGNGVNVEVVVDHGKSAKDVYGYQTDLFREGDWLCGILEMRGDEGISLAERNRNVSVLLNKNYKDGKGNEYGEAIQHVSISQQPVVSGQADFEAIAASRGFTDGEVPVLFSMSFFEQEDESTMKFIDDLKTLLGNDDVTEENAMSLLTEHVGALSQAKSDLEEKVKKFSAEKSNDEKRQAKPATDPDVLEDRAEACIDRIDQLVAMGKWSPKLKDRLTGLLLGKADERNEFALSRQNGEKPFARQLIDLLAENETLDLKEKTGLQTFSRDVPGEKSEPMDKETRERLSVAAKAAAGMSYAK